MLGLGLMKPSTIIAVQMIKMHIGNIRLETKMIVLIKSLNEYNIVESRIENEQVSNQITPYWTRTWVNKIKEECAKRKMTIENEKKEKKPITVNKTVMEYAVKYVEEKRCTKDIIRLINHIRLYKKSLFTI